MPDDPTDATPLPAEVPRVLAVLDRTLGDNLVAAYLFGSCVAGGLRPQSDLDLLVAVDRPVVGAARLALVGALLRMSGRHAVFGPSRPLEVSVVVVHEVRPWRFPPRCDLIFGEWLRDDLEAGRIAPSAPSPDLAILLSTLLEHHRLLAGRPAAQVFDPVPAGDLRRAIADCLPSLLGNLRGDERNVILTLARMWVTLATGTIVPKDAAAAWVLARLPAALAPVLELARAAYLGERDDDWSVRGTEVDAFASHAAGAVASLL